MAYEQIEHTADVGIKVCGNGPEELFREAGSGTFSLLMGKGIVADKECWQIDISGDDWEALLVEWLNEIIYLFESKSAIICRYEFEKLDRNNAKAKVYGESFDERRHEYGMNIKAATMHGLKVTKNKKWCAEIIFDV